MSASYVRSKMRQWAGEASAIVGLPQYYDTINVEVNPSDSVWWTLDFAAEYFEGTYCQKDYIEAGFIRLTVIAQPGTGDTGASAAMESLVPEIMGKVDPTQRLVLESYEPLQEQSYGSADNSYRISTILNYKLSL